MLNLSDVKTPGVYIDEVPKFPPSVAQVETAIPAFLGYTRNTILNGDSLVNRPIRITSLVEYEAIYGARLETFTVTANTNASGQNVIAVPPAAPATVYSSGVQFFLNAINCLKDHSDRFILMFWSKQKPMDKAITVSKFVFAEKG